MMNQQSERYQPPSYQFDIAHEGKLLKMVIRCPDCIGDSPLENPRCLTAVLLALTEDSNVDLVAISHYVEIQYGAETVNLLRMLTKMITELDRLATRGPMPIDDTIPPVPHQEDAVRQGTSIEKLRLDRQQAMSRLIRRMDCAHCPYNPETIHKTLREYFIQDISFFYNFYVDTVRSVTSNTQPGECIQCIGLTSSDLIYIEGVMDDLRQFILSKAFRIVDESQTQRR